MRWPSVTDVYKELRGVREEAQAMYKPGELEGDGIEVRLQVLPGGAAAAHYAAAGKRHATLLSAFPAR